jgi:uncharacterized protein (TIGR03437 family)
MAYWKYRVDLRRLADDIMFRWSLFFFSLLSCCLSAQTMPAFRWIQQVDGSGAEAVIGIGTDAAGNTYIAGNTNSLDFPVKSAAQNHSASTGLYRIDGSGAASPLPLAAAQTISPDPKNPKILYAANNVTASRSLDAGASWSTLNVANALVHSVQVDPSNSNVLYAASIGLGAFKSLDAGATWTSINTGIVSNQGQLSVYQFWFDPFHPNVLIANSTNGVRSADGGATWQAVPALAGLTNVWFDLTTPNLVYATTLSGALKSTDDGLTWTVLAAISGGAYFITSDPHQAGRLILNTGNSILESTDDGVTFTARITQQLSLWMTVDWANGALYAGSLVRISTDLKTVTPIGPPGLPLVNQVAVSNGQIYAAVSSTKDIFVTKLDPDGNIVYSTYFGGIGDETASNMAVDASGDVYVTGITTSRDFPVTAGAYSKSPPPGSIGVAANSPSFVLKLKPDGSVGYATYLTNGYSTPGGIAVNAAGEVVIGGTSQGDLPVTPGAYQTTFSRGPVVICAFFCGFIPISNAFVTKLDASGDSLAFSTYIGTQTATGGRVALANDGSIFMASSSISFDPGGQTVYHMNSTGSSLLGTGAAPGPAQILAVGVDGNLYVAGQIANGASFTGTPGAFQPAPLPVPPLSYQGPGGPYAFVTEMTSDLKQTVASTLLGGAYGDTPNSIAIDSDGNVLVGGATVGLGFPTRTPFVSAFNYNTGFVSKLSRDLSTLLFSTYLGDSEIFAVQGVAAAPGGDFVIAGSTGNVPSNSGPFHVWVNRLSAGGPPELRIDAVQSAASRLSSPLSPGETIVIRGAGFGADAQLIIGDTRVTSTTLDSQSITAVVPANITASAVLVQVQSGGAMTNPVLVPVAMTAPALYSADGSGFGQGYILNADGTRNSPANPAKIGDAVTIFASGVGPISFDGPYAVAAFTPQVYFDGFYANGVAAFSGPVAGLPGNVYQLKIIIPDPVKANSDLTNFKYPALVPVVLKSNGVASQNGLAISIGY